MWFTYALLAALMSGVSLVLNKRVLSGVNTSVLTFVLFVFPIPLVLVILAVQGVPPLTPAFVLSITASSFVFFTSKMLSLRMQKQHSVSSVTPFFSFSPFFSFVLALMLLNEHLKPIHIVGIFITVFGAYLIHVDKDTKHILDPLRNLVKSRMSIILLFAMFLSGFASIFDKIAVTNGSAALALFGEILIQSFLSSGYVLYKRIPVLEQIKKNFWILLLTSIVYTTLSLLVLTGFATGPVALVVSVKKLEIVFALVLGYLIFKDRPSKYVLVSLPLLILGTLLIRL